VYVPRYTNLIKHTEVYSFVGLYITTNQVEGNHKYLARQFLNSVILPTVETYTHYTTIQLLEIKAYRERKLHLWRILRTRIGYNTILYMYSIEYNI
jgi:hypothetical protein